MPSDYGLLVSLLHLSGDVIEGRKRFQKQVCILKHGYEVPFSFDIFRIIMGHFQIVLPQHWIV